MESMIDSFPNDGNQTGSAADTTGAASSNSPQKPKAARKDLPVGIYLGVTILTSLAVCIVFIPQKILRTASDNDALEKARLRLNRSVHEVLSAENLQNSAELGPLVADPLEKSAKDAAKAPFTSEDLRFGRYLVAKGNYAAAIPHYQSHLKQDPNAVKARMELIDLYLATKNYHDARALCISTLKRPLASEEIGSIWRQLSQCQAK